MKSKILAAMAKAPQGSKLYLGADSVRFKKGKEAFARISVVAVVHLGGKHGCQVIGTDVVERVYDKNLGRPSHRMMLEVYEVTNLYLSLVEELPYDTHIEVHLDINPDTRYGSSCAAKQAAGYVMGMCQIEPIMKPDAWAASTCADLFHKKLA
jgi:predicted RNase H-related nuclease YkuK (DUF458 family)